MPPTRLKKPVAVAEKKAEPDQEEVSRANTVTLFVQALQDGEFDGYLDTLYEAVDARIVYYQQEEGDPGQDPRERVEKLKSMRSEAPTPVEGRHYRVRGQKYEGVVVMFLERSSEDSDKAVVEVIGGSKNGLSSGKKYRIPLAVLEEIPEVKSVKTEAPAAQYFCKSCGDPVPYSGRGRPKSLCDTCERYKDK